MPGNLIAIPASVFSSWPTPNYDAKGRTWIVPYSIILEVITTVMVATRLWLRAMNQAGPLGLDDLFLIPGYLGATMFVAIAILSDQKYGLDRHLWDVPFHLFESTALCAFASEMAFLVSTCSTKISVLLFYRRLTQGTVSKRWKWATIGAIIFTALYGLAFILILVFSCRPTAAYWKAFSPTYYENYTCYNITDANPVSGGLSVFTDLYAVLLPMCMLWHFDAPKRQKVALNVVFSLGFLVVVAGIVRTYYLSALGTKFDTTWLGYEEYVWGILESQLALICASAPALRVFFRRYMSDPVNRMMHGTRSVSSENRHTNRESKHSGFGQIKYSQGRQNSRDRETEDKNPFKQHDYSVAFDTPDDGTIRETASPASTAPSYVIKTPADYELYNLQNLERNRPPPRPTFLRSPSVSELEAGMHPSTNGPLNGWSTHPEAKS